MKPRQWALIVVAAFAGFVVATLMFSCVFGCTEVVTKMSSGSGDE